MAGRYDQRVFSIWNKQGLSEAVQYYLFERISKKYNTRFEFGNKDCVDVMYFSMDEKYLIE